MRLSLEAIKRIDRRWEENNTFETGRYSLLKSAVLYGANASGKSNLIQAMKYFRWMLKYSATQLRAEDPIAARPFKLDPEFLLKASEVEAVFIIEGIKYRYGFEATKTEIVNEWLFEAKKQKENPLFFRAEGEIEVMPGFTEGKKLEDKTRKNALFISVVAQFNGTISTKIQRWIEGFNIISGIDDYSVQNITKNMMAEGWAQQFNQFIKRADVGIEKLAIEDSSIGTGNRERYEEEHFQTGVVAESPITYQSKKVVSFRKKPKGNQLIKFDFEREESEGTKKLFRFMGPVFDTLAHGKILVVDEMDARFHPSLTFEIVRLFNQKSTNPHHAQLVFATHDTNLLNSGLFRRDQIWFAEKNKEGATDLYSLAEYELPKGSKVRNDASYEKDYIKGRYGAIPYFGDFEQLFNKEAWPEDPS